MIIWRCEECPESACIIHLDIDLMPGVPESRVQPNRCPFDDDGPPANWRRE
jgi:hypothetical protein